MEMDRKGFTLIELLVVIAIIAILAAILFPVFISAKESAQQAKCISNLKQVAAAGLMYAGDNGDKLPPTYFVKTLRSWVAPLHWVSLRYSLLNSYMKNINVQLCPSGTKWVYYTGEPPSPTYAMNQAVFGMSAEFYFYGGGGVVPPPWIKVEPPVLGSIVNPSRTIMLMDMYPSYAYIWSSIHTEVPGSTHPHRWLSKNPYDLAPDYPMGGKVTGVDSAFHNGGTVFAFSDGHVKWFKTGTKEIDTDEWWDLK